MDPLLALSAPRCNPSVTWGCQTVLVLLALSVSSNRAARGDDVNDLLAKKVAAIVRQLDADERADRDKAEQDLLKLGATALPHLPALESRMLSAEQRRRLAKVLPVLWEEKLKFEVAGSLVTLPKEPIALSDALARVSKQTGIRVVDLRDKFNQEVTDPMVTVGGGPTPFWQTLDRVVAAAGLSYYAHTEDRSVGIVGRPGALLPVSYAGAFRIEAKKLVLQSDFDKTRECLLQMELMVEPRLRPISVEIDTDRLKADDDRGHPIPFAGPKSIPIEISGSAYLSSLTLRMQAPPRDATQIAQLIGEVGVWLPAQVESFEFPMTIGGKPIQKDGAGVKVELRTVRDEDGVWSVPVVIERTGKNDKVDSHVQVRMENEIYLQKTDGTRFNQNGGLSSIDEPGKTGVELLFTDVPGKIQDYHLLVRVPSGVTRLPVKFAFKNLALP